MQRLVGNAPVQRHVGRVLVDIDLANLLAREAGLARQCAQHIAGADFFFAPADNLQGHHGRHQRLLAGRRQIFHLVPLGLGVLQLFDAPDRAHLVHRCQADRPTLFVSAAGAADAMNMHFAVGRNVHVDDHLQLRNVQPARRDVSGHQHRAAAVGKLHQHLVAFTLLQLAVECQRTETLSLQDLHQLATLQLGVAKGQRAGRSVMVEQLRDGVQALTVPHLVPALADFAGFVLRFNLHRLRLAHELLAELGNAFGVSG